MGPGLADGSTKLKTIHARTRRRRSPARFETLEQAAKENLSA